MSTGNDLPGISLKDEQRQLQNIIGIAQDNLDRAKESVKKLTDDLEDLRDVALFHRASPSLSCAS